MKEISSEQRLKTGLAQQLIGANPVILNIKFHISLLSVVSSIVDFVLYASTINNQMRYVYLRMEFFHLFLTGKMINYGTCNLAGIFRWRLF